jgi:hypothetical protein
MKHERGVTMETVFKAEKRGKQLELQMEIPTGVKEIQVRLYSGRNDSVSRLSDVSPNHPERERLLKQAQPTGDVLFPVMDVAFEPGMSAVVAFDNEPEGYFVINGATNKFKEKLYKEISIEASLLDYWENNLFVTSPVTIQSVYLRDVYRVNERIHFRHTYNLLSEAWNGRVEIYSVEPEQRFTLLGRRRLKTESA